MNCLAVSWITVAVALVLAIAIAISAGPANADEPSQATLAGHVRAALALAHEARTAPAARLAG